MNNFELDIPTKIYFGNDITKSALKKEREIFGDRVLIVSTGRSLKRLGYLDRLENIMKVLLGDENVCVYDNISANPDVDEIQNAVELGKSKGVKSVIGFGGGSAIDAAKAAAVGIVSDDTVEKFLLNSLSLPYGTLPIIAIPTTAGTGSELSKAAIISSRKHNVKSGIRGEKIIPKVAIVDPVYTWSAPLGVTMESGFDVFAHAAESYCSNKANAFSKTLSEKAIKIVGQELPKLAKNLDDHDARFNMSYASMIMGFNLKNVGNCLPHRMQYPVGVLTNTSHGAGLAAIFPSWLSYESNVKHNAVNDILNWLGFEKAKNSEDVKFYMLSFLQKLNVEKTLSLLGVKENASKLASMVTGDISSDGLSEQKEIIETIYNESM